MIYKKTAVTVVFLALWGNALRLHGGDGVVCVHNLGPGVKPQDDNFFNKKNCFKNVGWRQGGGDGFFGGDFMCFW